MHQWKKFNLFKTSFYIVVMSCFATVIFINISIKPPENEKKNYTKKKIIAANIFSLIGFCLLLTHHYINTLWKEGFIIVTFMVLLSLYSTYKSI